MFKKIPGTLNFKINLKDYIDKKIKQLVVVENKDGETNEFKSMREASRVLGIPRKTIAKYLKTGKIFKGYKYRLL